MSKQKQKIFVGISGGVDSSVAAHLLKKDGHEVHGVFVKTWSPEWLPCTWVDEKRDAMRVCAALNIPFHFLDAEEEYKKGVAEYMIAEYKAGRTPNPDVLCNRVIKFGALWQYAKNEGADMLATGHYAQVKAGGVCKGVDEKKDQSYFLWMITPSELTHICFPVGGLKKEAVRKIAVSAKLPTAGKKDSQGICFLGDVDMRAFLLHYIEQKPGAVVDEKGKVVGLHEGVWFYTLGERHGFTITDKETKKHPSYVIGKDVSKNVLIVAHDVQSLSQTGKIVVQLKHSTMHKTLKKRKKYSAQIRYHGAMISSQYLGENKVALTTSEPIACGQSLVMYDGEKLVAGGVVDSIE